MHGYRHIVCTVDASFPRLTCRSRGCCVVGFSDVGEGVGKAGENDIVVVTRGLTCRCTRVDVSLHAG